MTWAYAEYKAGVREVAGPSANPRIIAYFRACGTTWIRDDETPWCAAGVGAGLVESGISVPLLPLRARSYLGWGVSLDKRFPAFGAVAVLSRGTGAQPGPEVLDAPGHVGLVVAIGPGEIVLLGGNQGDAWSIKAYSTGSLLGLRWPKG